MAGKPSLQFYPGDWWRALDVKGCSMCTQGVWFNLLMRLWDAPEQGKLRDTKEGVCRIIGANLDELEEFIEGNKARHFANVTFRNNKVTIINRRMYHAYIERESTKKRVQSHRERQKRRGNGKVTPYTSTSPSTSYNTTINPTLQNCYDSAILVGITNEQAKAFYEHYKPQGWMWGNGQPMCPPLQDCMVRWRNNQYKFNKDVSNGKAQRAENRGDSKKPFVR